MAEFSKEFLTKEQILEVLELAPDAILVIGHNNKTIFASNQAENMFGYPDSELVGKNYEVLIPKRFREKHSIFCEKYLKEPAVKTYFSFK